MKKLASAVAAILIVTPAFAADLRVKSRPAPPAPAAAPAPVWTGWYVGVNAGWVGTDDSASTNATVLSLPGDPTTSTTLAAAAANQLGHHRADGFIGGGQLGYNWQFSPNFLAGFETDIQGSSASGTATATNAVLTNTTSGINTATWNTATTISDRLDYLGTVRGRIGWIATPTFLAYGTGGFAYGGEKSSTSMAINATFLNGTPVGGVPPGFAAGSFSGTRTGWAAGGGFEWMFLPGWTAKLEYLHYDLGSETYGTGGYSVNVGPTSLPSSGFATIATSTTVHFQGDIVRVGLNYLFH